MPNSAMSPLLRVRNLSVGVGAADHRLTAVDKVSFEVEPGETLAIVGESGCGKSLTAFSLIRLLPKQVAITGGEIEIDGLDVIAASPAELRHLRGKSAAMVFQEPMTALNPVVPIGTQIIESLRIHGELPAATAHRKGLELLSLVGVTDPERRLKAYPHELSGGMRQRAMIALAMACEPKLLIADEPTTALDVTVQAQILKLFQDLQRKVGMAMVLITHDFGVVAQVADKVAVMYAGRFVEKGSVEEILTRPRHPYTQALLACATAKRPAERSGARGRLAEIGGLVPALGERDIGCSFLRRCSKAGSLCAVKVPDTVMVGSDHAVECWHADQSRADVAHPVS